MEHGAWSMEHGAEIGPSRVRLEIGRSAETEPAASIEVYTNIPLFYIIHRHPQRLHRPSSQPPLHVRVLGASRRAEALWLNLLCFSARPPDIGVLCEALSAAAATHGGIICVCLLRGGVRK